MKALLIDYSYYFYPEQTKDLEEFVQYANEQINRFIPMVQLLEDNCVEPYFIEGETSKCYVNLSHAYRIQEVEVTLLPKEEYDKRLAKCVQRTCLDCISYEEDKIGDNLSGHRTKINLDNRCHYRSLQPRED